MECALQPKWVLFRTAKLLLVSTFRPSFRKPVSALIPDVANADSIIPLDTGGYALGTTIGRGSAGIRVRLALSISAVSPVIDWRTARFYTMLQD